MSLLKKIFGTRSEREIKKLRSTLDEVLELDEKYSKMSKSELKGETQRFKKELEEGKTLDDILPEAFAVAREAAWRVLGLKPYEVQVLGGIILHQGKVAEMRTGEGKTLVATMPVYLNALEGKGVYVVTVNDYLAKRDSEQMSKIYSYLGLTTGLIEHNMVVSQRKEEYAKDIVYCTNNEVGFDYLKDNMVPSVNYRVQRGFNYAIIDEIDSILIDEARTPLIISGKGDDLSSKYGKADQLVRKLKGIVDEEEESDSLMSRLEKNKGEKYGEYDYVVDEKQKAVSLTEKGISKAEKFYKIKNLGDFENLEINHYINIALKAHSLFKNNIDYVIKDGEIVIIDEHTGRLMEGRRYSEGIHQAIETKEGMKIQNESKTLATISFQNLFRKFSKLSGMTGTGMTEKEEFENIYGLDVIEVPTNKPVQRIDVTDKVYTNKEYKKKAILERVKECNEKGQPIIVGTSSVQSSEELSKLFNENNIKHKVLNAKFHEKEAEIIAQAGEYKAVTIATNMAGRGTDIMLGGNAEFKTKKELSKLGYPHELIEEATTHYETDDKDILEIREKYEELSKEIKKEIEPKAEVVKQLGGLYILGTERHQSRRIDNQLRGRAGRQGDPGVSEFILSLEDDLLRMFGVDRLKDILSTLNMPVDVPIDAKLVSNSIEKAQNRVEGDNYHARKTILEYDSVIERQREVIYNQRNKTLDSEDLSDDIVGLVKQYFDNIFENETPNKKFSLELQNQVVSELSNVKLENIPDYDESSVSSITKEDAMQSTLNEFEEKYSELQKILGKETMKDYQKKLLLFQIDFSWQEQMMILDELKEGIGLRAMAEEDPLQAYELESYKLFESMMNYIAKQVLRSLMNTHYRLTHVEEENKDN